MSPVFTESIQTRETNLETVRKYSSSHETRRDNRKWLLINREKGKFKKTGVLTPPIEVSGGNQQKRLFDEVQRKTMRVWYYGSSKEENISKASDQLCSALMEGQILKKMVRKAKRETPLFLNQQVSLEKTIHRHTMAQFRG